MGVQRLLQLYQSRPDSEMIRLLAKITKTGKMPIPQEKMTLVGWASCPSDKLMKMTFVSDFNATLSAVMTPEGGVTGF